MQELTRSRVHAVSGAVSEDAAYGAAVGVGVALLAIGLTVTAPVWGTALLLGGSIAASGLALNAAH